ncbi:MAG TPA: hypothetical protein VIY86_00940, partial [Pirellulaceae bacterium]
ANLPPLNQYGLSPEDVERIEVERRQHERVFGALTELSRYYNRRLLDNPEALAWVKSQYGFTPEMIEHFTIGFSANDSYLTPGGEIFPGAREVLRKHKDAYSTEELISAGTFLLTKSERVVPFFENRLVFPHWSRGRVVFLTARKTPWTSDAPWEQPKYKKLPVFDPTHELWRHIAPCINNSTLWGEDALLSRPHHLVITEGIADAIWASHWGFSVVSPLTVHFKATDAERLAESCTWHGISRISICMDNEMSEVGLRASLKAAREFQRRVSTVRVASLPLGPEQEEARAGLLSRFGAFTPVTPATLRKHLEGRSDEDIRDAFDLMDRAKVDIAEWARRGGTGEEFRQILESGKSALEHAISSIPRDGLSEDRLAELLDPILVEISNAHISVQERLLRLLRERAPGLPPLGTLRKHVHAAANRAATAEKRDRERAGGASGDMPSASDP